MKEIGSYLGGGWLRGLLKIVVVSVGRPDVATDCSALDVERARALLTRARDHVPTIVVLVNHVVVRLAAAGIRLAKESVVPQLILKWLDLRVDTRERDPGEVSKVLAYRYVQGVRPVKHVRVRLKVSS